MLHSIIKLTDILTRNSTKPDPKKKKKNRINKLNKYKQTYKKVTRIFSPLTWNPNKVKVIKKYAIKSKVKKIDPYPNTEPLQHSSEQGR